MADVRFHLDPAIYDQKSGQSIGGVIAPLVTVPAARPAGANRPGWDHIPALRKKLARNRGFKNRTSLRHSDSV